MKKQLIIVMQGGFLTSVTSDTPEAFADVEIVAVDYDTECAAEADLTPVIQPDGDAAQAFVGVVEVDRARISVPSM
jgi:hypothetical protein